MIGVAPLILVAAAAVVVLSGFLTASAGQVLIARALAVAAAAVFASGYGLVMWGHLRPIEHAIVTALSRVAVGAVSTAALITVSQLLLVNDTVAAGVRLALWVLVATGVVGTALVPLARVIAARSDVS